MKRVYMAAAAGCFALAALAGCTRHGPDCGVDYCVCDLEETTAVRNTESDLVIFDNAPEPVDGAAETAAAEKKETPGADVADVADAPAAVVSEVAEAADSIEEPDAADAEEEGFSAEEMARKIREMEASTENEPRIIQGIIDDGYGEVPTVVSEAPALNIEILPAGAESEVVAEAVIEPEVVEESAPLRDMAADYEKYLDIESYDAEPVVEEVAPVASEVVDVPFEAPEAPVAAPVIAEAPAVVQPVIESVQEPESVFLLPPPLASTPAPAPGPATFAAEVGPDRSEAAEDLTLEGLDDMDLEFFGSISESLLEDGGEG